MKPSSLRVLVGDYCSNWSWLIFTGTSTPFFISARMSKVWYYPFVRDWILLRIIGGEKNNKKWLKQVTGFTFCLIMRSPVLVRGLHISSETKTSNFCSAILMEWPHFNNGSWCFNLLDRKKGEDKGQNSKGNKSAKTAQFKTAYSESLAQKLLFIYYWPGVCNRNTSHYRRGWQCRFLDGHTGTPITVRKRGRLDVGWTI